MSSHHDFLAGCMGGAASVVVGQPLDTIKVRLQTGGSRYGGIISCFTKIVQAEGSLGLFKGVTAPLFSVAAINAVIFGVHGHVSRSMKDPDSLYTQTVAGACAGFVQAFINGPVELVKIRMQQQGQGQHLTRQQMAHKSNYDCVRTLYRAGGTQAVLRGMNITLCREVPAFAIYFFTDAYFKQLLTPEGETRCSVSGLLLAGGLAGSASWLFTYPIDVVKTRIQGDGTITERGIIRYQYASYGDCLRQSVQKEGYRVLGRGCWASVIRAFPVNAALLTVHDLSMRYLRGEEAYVADDPDLSSPKEI